MTTAKKKILTLPLRLCIPVLIIGVLLKIMHWPYGALLMSIAFGSIFVLYCFRFAHKAPKLFVDFVKLILIGSWCIHGFLVVYHLPFRFYVQLVWMAALLTWLVMEGMSYFSDKAEDGNTKIKTFKLVLIVPASILIVAGAIFKIMHWPYGIYMLIAGFALIIIWFIVDSLGNKSE